MSSPPKPTVRIIAERVRGADLQPGDLFSTAGTDYWDHFSRRLSLGEQVYIRTEVPTPPDQADEPIYRLTIQRL